MGDIKDGAISGCFPSIKTFVVHYPGYPSSASRAIETLGGGEGILKARSSNSNKMELRFRPEDPFCHPTFGELRQCNNFLLRITKRSTICTDPSITQDHDAVSNTGMSLQGDQCTSSSGANKEEDQTQLCADITARVSEAYVFQGMADYQHVVAVHADIARRKKKTTGEVEAPPFAKDGLTSVESEDLMMIVPPLFSSKDVPTTLALSRPPTTSNLKRKQDTATEHVEVFVENSLALDFKIKEIPKIINWEERLILGSDEWERQMAVSKLFEERPIWPKNSLYERLLDRGLNFGVLLLKRSCSLLTNVAYYFNNGPFLKFWIRKGYDPREDPESRIYQGIDFRVPQPLQSNYDLTANDELEPRWEDICAFRVFPRKYHVSLQFCELVDEYIQQEIRNSPGKSTCTFKTGWFSEPVLDSLRQRIMMRVLSLYPKPGAESFLKLASERFEKSKKMRFLDNTVKIDKRKDQQDKGEENPVIDTDNDEEEEEIDDAGEEDVDAYAVAEEGDISLQSFPYAPMENISRTYLQELFGSFPSMEHGFDVQNADGSDGEFQIYEQESEENYSDDYEDED
ncbi:hypothetical protein BT93_G0011 [Corymbia citriodora subsp. variegata]|nr:hypothetical protein BT93_G0011 [Corymbia citriodora subsp. variegata]